MRCLIHKKELIGNCTWCGKQLCLLCIAKKEGKKFYCEKCATQLAGIQRIKLPRITETQQRLRVEEEQKYERILGLYQKINSMPQENKEQIIKEFNKSKRSDYDDLIEESPWINPDKLTPEDKIFLYEEDRKIGEAIREAIRLF